MIAKLKTIFLLTFFISNLYAGSAIVRVEPQQPAVGDIFNVIFEIETNNSDEPFIAFDPGDLSVQGKGETGYSTRTTIINGRITTERKMTVSYNLSADKAGTSALKNISITVGDEKIAVKDLKIQILSESSKSKDIFILTELSKDVAYIGEGVTVNYYLYSKLPLTTMDFDNFPKLNDFVKRFYNPTGAKETVKYNGELMARSLRYSARIFPTKAGELEVDPLRLRIGYMESDNYNPYSVLGIGYGKTKTKTISSQRMKLIVKELPSNPPAGFTGLVGKHSFKLLAPRSKYLVNEAIELKFEAEGEGLLEKYDGPQVYDHPELESFDVKADLKEDGQGSARKIYDITYLARNNLSIPAKNLDLYYLNPTNDQYEKVTLPVPELVASGAAANAQESTGGSETEEATEAKESSTAIPETAKKVIISQEVRELSPIFSSDAGGWNIYQKINIGLVILIFAFFIEILLRKILLRRKGLNQIKVLLKKFNKGEVTYALLYSFLDLCLKGDGSVSYRLEKSDIDPESKRYFLSLLDNLGNSEYKAHKAFAVSLNESHLKAMLRFSGKRHETLNPYL